MTNDKHFWKTTGQQEFNHGLITKLPRILVALDFLQSLLKLKRGFLPPLIKYVF